MSVIVKGMRMPEKCGSCELFHAEFPMYCTVVKGHKTVGAPYGMPRPEWCPLVELPEKHGDLIDRDYLMEHLYTCEINGRPMHIMELDERLACIDEVPTVIEAEGEQ